MFEKIKSFWAKNGRFFTFENTLNIPTIFILYLILLSPLYLFSFLVNKNFFTLEAQLDFLGTAWIPLIFYFEFVILGFIQFKREGVYPSKIIGTIQSKKDFIKSIIYNNYAGYKLELSRPVIFIFGYILVNFLLFKIIQELYFDNLSRVMILFLFLIFIKIYLLFFISDLISHVKSFRDKIFYSFIGIVLSDFLFLAYRLLFEKTAQVQIVKDGFSLIFASIFDLISKIPETILTVIVVFLIGVVVLLFLPQKKVKIYGSEKMSLLNKIFSAFLSCIFFSLLIIISFSSAKAGAHLIEPIYIGLLMREFFLLGFILFLSYLFLSRSLEGIKESQNSSSEFTKLNCKIEGFSRYTNRRKITQDFSFDKVTEFFSVKDTNNPNNGNIEMAMPKRNLFSPINNSLYVNDEVEAIGFFYKTNDLQNPQKNIRIFIPLIIKVTKFSKLREIMP